MMKKLIYYLFIVALIPAFYACSNEDEPNTPPPSKGEEAVEKIVETLESKPEVSQFVELLKKTDMADVTEEQFTVFAVKNPTGAALNSRVEALNETSLKRHIAKGSYTKEQLTDGMKLESLNGETLYITRTGNDVFVNGTIIEGEAIPAGNSYIYVVPEVIQKQEAPVSYKHQTTINVKELAAKYIMDGVELPPLSEVTVTAKDGNNNLPVGTFKTNAEGIAIISHNCDTLTYRLEKTDYTDMSDGWIYSGKLSADGFLMFKDLNGDGMIDNQDQVYDAEWPYQLDYRNVIKEANSTQEHFMVTVEKTNKITEAWATAMSQYYTETNYLNRQLLTGEGGFSYNDVAQLSEQYITMALETQSQFAEYRNMLREMGQEGSHLDYSILTDMQEIEVNLYEYYNFGKEYMIEVLYNYRNSLPAPHFVKAQFWLAKVFLLEERYDDALAMADDLIQKGLYTNNPVMENETLLICAIANYKNGNMPKAIETLNQVREIYDEEPVTSLDENLLIETCHISLMNTEGQLYPYYRILDKDINCWSKVDGFDGTKHHLLPYPQSMIDNGTVIQNPGY